MKKYLLIPALLIAAVASASAHCGSCGTEKSHDKAAEKATSDKAAKAECDKEKAAAKKSCCPSQK